MSSNSSATNTTLELILKDGRRLSYGTFGASGSNPAASAQLLTAFLFHGFPGSHHEGHAVHEAASTHGVRIVSVSRPGYAGSSPEPKRTVSSFALDVLELADHLNVRRFAVLGISGGGPYALGCISKIPADRLAGTVVVSGMYPTSLGLSEMMLSNRFIFNLAPWAPWLIGCLFDSSIGAAAKDSMPPEDLRVVEADGGRLLDIFTASMREAFRDGSAGAAYEAALFGNPWDFDLETLPVRTGELVVYHGGKDIHVPLRMAKEAAARMRGVQLIVEENQGHTLGFCETDEIMGRLRQML
ncbi:Alpha/Beta hydrolase protein [Apiospora saccharicola]|uniref:Alpha/Beta hydrolase protein n=1 Tax=Apiospora saccharicola TaxID=335842 RepID=A0ABR1TL45_9PEZI